MGTEIPKGSNIAQILIPTIGSLDNAPKLFKRLMHLGRKAEFTDRDAYNILVNKGLAPAPLTDKKIKEILESQIKSGLIDFEIRASLNSIEKRTDLYNLLIKEGKAPKGISIDQMGSMIKRYQYFNQYVEPSRQITDAVSKTLQSINRKVGIYQFIDLTIEGISLASIYFLAAIGLAITFGVMRVINMAHGEFIMMGAYTGYVV